MKSARHNKIIELVNQYDIETQEELADYLNREGFHVTQATVSRDIRELKLTKVVVDGTKMKYVAMQTNDNSLGDKYLLVLKEGFVSIGQAENMLVIKTVSGMAMAVAAALDALQWNEVVGCIAGDDTIMAAVRTREEAPVVMERLKKLTHFTVK
jgi:transcriptional regulator of arginine metabolism